MPLSALANDGAEPDSTEVTEPGNLEGSGTDETANDSQETNTNNVEVPETGNEPSTEQLKGTEPQDNQETNATPEDGSLPLENEEEVGGEVESFEQKLPSVKLFNSTAANKEWTLAELNGTQRVVIMSGTDANTASTNETSPSKISTGNNILAEYSIELPDTGIRVKPGDTVRLPLPEGITPNFTSTIVNTSGANPIHIATLTHDGKDAILTFTENVATNNGITVTARAKISIFDQGATNGDRKTVKLNMVPYYFESYYVDGGQRTAKVGSPENSTGLIKWTLMFNYSTDTAPVSIYEDVIITDILSDEIDLITLDSGLGQVEGLTIAGERIDDYFTLTCEGGCPTGLTFTATPIKNELGKTTSFKLVFNQDIPADRIYTIRYFTLALDYGVKNNYQNSAYAEFNEQQSKIENYSSQAWTNTATASQANVRVTKKDEQDNRINGAAFKLEKQNIDESWTEVNELNTTYGQAFFGGLLIGNYKLTETIFPSGYGVGNYKSNLTGASQEGASYLFKIDASHLNTTGAAVEITAVNKLLPTKGSVKISKYDKNATSMFLPDAKFKIEGIGIFKEVTTGSDGTVTEVDLPAGTYTVTETKAPSGYALNPDSYEVTIVAEQTAELSVPNEKLGSVVLTKEDGTYKSVKLKDVEFTLSNANGTYTATTDADGIAAFPEVVPGEYRLTETATPKGYITMEPVTITVESGKEATYTAVNKRDSYSLTLTKVNSISKNPLEGVKFTLERLNEDTNEYTEVGTTETTNSDGVIEFKDLGNGTYRVKEVAALPGFDQGDYSLPIQVNKDTTVTVENVPYSTVLITKVDSVETATKLDGAQFELYQYNNQTNVYERYDQEIYTTVNGQVKIERLPVGKYELKEIVAPNGYWLLGQPVKFEVTVEDMDTPAQVINVEVKNDKILGKVTLTKIDQADNKPLAGAAFKLQKENADGVYEDESSNNVTNSNGQIVIDGLVPGNYQLVETAAPFGYKADSKPIKFTISDSQVDHKFKFPNEKFYGEFKLTKVEGESNALIPGTEFTLSKVNADKTTTELEKFVTDAQGMIAKSGLEAGNYQLVETKAAPGYYIDATPITFTIGENATNSVNNELQDGMALVHDFTFKNHQILGEFKLTKVDQDDAKALENVEFQLSKWNETIKQYEPIRDIFTTDKNGVISSGALTIGQYELKEVKAAYGYYLNSTPITFTINENAETNTALTGGAALKHEFTFTNELILGSFELTKVRQGNAQVVLPGVEFKLSKWNEETEVYDIVIEEKLVTDATGKVAKDGLTVGQYQIVETKTLGGYYLNSTPIEFTIGSDNEENTSLKDGTALKHTFTFENALIPPTPPVNPIDPVDPVNPPVNPTNPVDPTEPVNPTDPVDPTEPVNPTDPVDPTEPVNPTDPVDPTNPPDSNVDGDGDPSTDPVTPTPIDPDVNTKVENVLDILDRYEQNGILTMEDYNNLHEMYQLYLGMNPEQRSQFEQYVDVAKMFALLNQQTRLPQTDAVSSTPLVMVGLLLMLLSLFALRFRRNKAQ